MTSVLDLDLRTVLNSRHSESTWYTMHNGVQVYILYGRHTCTTEFS